MLSITNVKANLAGMLHDVDVDGVANITNLLNRAAREVMSEIDFEETKRRQNSALTLHDSVHDYAAPTDLKMDRIFDIRKQVNRGPANRLYNRDNERFDASKGVDLNTFTVEYRNGVKVLRISEEVGGTATVESANSTQGWAAGGDANNLTLDQQNYVSGGASLRYDLTGASTSGYLETVNGQNKDLSLYEDSGALFVWVFIPDADGVTSYDLRWGG